MRDTSEDTARPGLTRLFARLLARPLWPGLALALLTAFALWQTTQVHVAVNLSGLIGPQTAGAQAIREYERRFEPMRAEEVLLVRAPDFGTEQALRDLEDLVLELQFVDGVDQIISLAGLPAPGRDGAWLSGPELASLPPSERLILMRAQNPLASQLISEDLTSAVVVVIPEHGAGGEVLAAGVLEAAALIDRLEVQNVGLAAVQRAIAQELIYDLSVLTPMAVGLCLILSMLLFRSWRVVVVIALPAITGLFWFFGWMGATGTGIDPVMGALPVLLVVLALSDSIHIYHAAVHANEASGATGGRASKQVLARAMAETAPAAAMTSLTTIIAFASLSIPDSPSLNTMSYAGVAGMILSLTAVLTLTPLFMWALGVPRLDMKVPQLFSAIVIPARAVSRMRRTVPVVTLLVLGGFWLMQSQSQIGFRYADYLPRGAAVSEALAQMEQSGLGSDRMVVIIEADPDNPLDRVRRAVDAIWGEGRSGWTMGAAGEDMLARMAARDGTAHALPVQLPIAARDIRADVALGVLRDKLEAAGLTENSAIIGPGYALLTEGPRLVQSLRLGLYGTIAVITLLVALVYRSWWLGLVSMVVNLIPILGVEAWLVLIGRELTIMNVIALTIAFGIAVDDTLHFLNRYRLARAGPTHDRATQALMDAGPPMVATTLILLAGMVMTLTSALPGMAVYGGLIALAILLALLTDLFLLPGLIRSGLPRWSRR